MNSTKDFVYNYYYISNPDLQNGLTELIPHGEIPVNYLNFYDNEYEVRCAFCDNHTPHKRGFTAEMEDGRIALCGRNCGQKYFGEQADQLEAILTELHRRELNKRIVERTLNGVPTILGLWQDDWESLEKQILKIYKVLHSHIGKSEFINSLNEDGHFQKIESTTRWEERIDRNGQLQRVPVYDEVVSIEVKYAATIFYGAKGGMNFTKLKSILNQMNNIDSNTLQSDKMIERLRAHRSNAMDHARDGFNFLNTAKRFFSKDNIANLSKVARDLNTNIKNVALHKRDFGYELNIQTFSGFQTEYEVEKFNLIGFDNLPTKEIIIDHLK